MTEKNSEWWKQIFDKYYLVTDARSVCDEQLTCREVDFLEETLQLKKTDRILDLCGGQGRHSIELARRQYQDITVLDYSQFLIDHGRAASTQQGFNIKFLQADARSTPLKDSDYGVILVMGNSFGYCLKDTENISMLEEILRLLRPQGKVLLDLIDPDYITSNFRPSSEHQAEGGFIIQRQRKLLNDALETRETLRSRDRNTIRDITYREKLYTREKIEGILQEKGFRNIRSIQGFSRYDKAGDYGFMSSRMIVLAQKA